MDSRQSAVLWWKQLLAELGSGASKHSDDEPSRASAARRHDSLVELFFSLAQAIKAERLYEVGAHLAETSARFVALLPRAKALAFEANPTVCQRALANGMPAAVSYRQVAVGAKQGSITFFAPNDEHYQIWGSTRRRAGYDNVTPIEVPMTTLDDLAREVEPTGGKRRAALWVDVEGTALSIFQGGRSALGSSVGLIYAELNDIMAYEGSATSIEVIELLLEAGFVPIARDNEWHDAWNILLVHGELIPDVQDVMARWCYRELTLTRSR